MVLKESIAKKTEEAAELKKKVDQRNDEIYDLEEKMKEFVRITEEKDSKIENNLKELE